MNIERIISEYENELAALKWSLKASDCLERKMELAEEIYQVEEIINELKEEKRIEEITPIIFE